jgi:S-disulfanyl-L-cysteine oxidoreductase SoxD
MTWTIALRAGRRFFRRHRLSRMIPLTTIFFAALAPLQTPPATSVWDGVYTAAQAERGRAVYDMRCARCHATDLRGVNGSSLAGEGFLLHWEGRTVERLVRKIRETMPPEGAGTMTDRETVDTVAYLLQQNRYPDGSNELALEPATLAGIQIRSGAGPAVVRNGALVQATGCLTPIRDEGWLLKDATEPEIATLDPEPPRAPDNAPGANAATIARGTRTISLMNVFPEPTAHNGHTVRARGFLVRGSSGDRINVVTLEMVESRCER